MVWCPQTLNGTWLAKRNGKIYFTGNSKSVSSAASKSDILDAPLFNEACKLLLAQEDAASDILNGISHSSEHVFPNSYVESEMRDNFPGRW